MDHLPIMRAKDLLEIRQYICERINETQAEQRNRWARLLAFTRLVPDASIVQMECSAILSKPFCNIFETASKYNR